MTKFTGYGLGINHDHKPVCVNLPPEIDAIVRSLPNRSEKLRQWIIEGVEREGLFREE
jgi:hypothetical protein